MRTILCLFILIISSNYLSAQQDEYKAYLEQAWQAVQNNDEKSFNSNLKYFSVAIERDKITPEILSPSNLTLYTTSLYQALTNKFQVSDELGKQAISFLQYDLENHPENYFSIAYLYENGFGVEKDFVKAIYWYEKAINIGNSSVALNNLGNIYYIQKNYTQAKYWFEQASKKNVAAGIHGLAYLYEEGLGVEKDTKKAIELYEKAGNGGYKDAMFNLGLIYKNGTGTAKNITKSKYWFKKAAEKGDVEAMVHLGLLGSTGDSVMQNQEDASYWFQKACDLGYELGCEYLN